MKRINVKLVAILVATTLILGIGSIGLYRFQMRRNTQKFWTQAQNYKEQGDLENARKSLLRYIQYAPEDKEKMGVFAIWSKEWFDDLVATKGMSGITGKDFQRAFGPVESAVREFPDDNELRDVAIELSETVNRTQDTIAHLRTRIENATADEDISEYLLKLATYYARVGEDKLSATILSELIGLDPSRLGLKDASIAAMGLKTEAKTTYPATIEGHLIMAELLVSRLKSPELADVVIERMVQTNPESPLAHMGRARYLRSRGKGIKEAVQSANRALALPASSDEERSQVLKNAASIFMAVGQYEPAKQLLDRYLEKNPDNPDPYQQLADWANRQNRLDAAREYIDEGLEKHPNDIGLHESLINLELDRNSSDGVEASVQFLRQKNVNQAIIDFYMARLDFANGNTLRAARKLKEIAPDVTRMRPSLQRTIDRTLATAYTRLGEHDRALESYKSVIEAGRGDDRTFWGAINAFRKLGQFPAAIQSYESFVNRLANEERLTPDYPFLLECLEMELIRQKQSVEPDFRFAENIVRMIRESKTIDEDQKYAILATYFDTVGDPSRASQVRNFIEKNDPDNIPLQIQKIQAKAQTDGAGALSDLDALEAREGRNVLGADLLRIILLMRQNAPGVREKLLAIEQDVDGYDPSQKATVYKELAKAYLYLQESNQSYRLFGLAAAEVPEDTEARMAMLKLALQREDDKGITSTISDIQSTYGADSAVSNWAQALKLIWLCKSGQGNDEMLAEAQGLVDAGLAKRESWAELRHLSAEIATIKGDTSTALSEMQKAIASGKTQPAEILSYASLLQAAGRVQEAKMVYESIDRRLWSPKVELVYLKILSQLGELPEEIVFNATSADPYYHLNVGKIAMRDAAFLTQMKADAELIRKRQLFAAERFQAAVDQEPTIVEAWQFLVRALAGAGKQEEALAAIRKAQVDMSEKRLHIFLAQSNQIIGNDSEAYAHYKSHLQNYPDDLVAIQGIAGLLYAGDASRHKEADGYVDKILATPLSPDATPEERKIHSWARQTKARTLVRSNTFHDFEKALAILEEGQDANGLLQPEDLVLYGQMAGARNDGVSHAMAITKFEKVHDAPQRELTRPELIVLAELYKRADRWQECASIMNSLLAKTPNDMSLLTPWLTWLLEDDQLRQAEKWLANADPKSMAYIRTRAHLWVKNGDSRKALALLQPLMPKQIKTDAQKAQTITLAIYMEQMGQDDPRFYPVVEKIWRRYTAQFPGESMRLASYLGRRDDPEKIDDALQLCGEFVKAGKAQQALPVAVTILRNNQERIPVGSPQHDLVQSWFDAAERAAPDDPALAIQRSELDAIVGDFDQAIENLNRYRQSPGVTPQQKAMANNNLAYIFALQGKGDEALALVDESVGILGPISDLLDTRAMAQLALGKNDLAIEDLTKAIAYGGESSFKRFHLALAEMEAGQDEQAKESIQRAIALGLELNKLNALEKKQFEAIVAKLDVEQTEPVSTVAP